MDPNQFLAAAVETADDAIICSDRDGCITAWNRAAQRVLGYAPAEIIGRDISVLFPPEGQREEAAALVQIWNGEQAPCCDRTLVRKDGRRIELSVAMSPIRDAAGAVIGSSKICRDVTDKKKAEIASLHLSAIVSSSDDVIISKDLNGIVQSWNSAAERMFGYTASEMIGQSIRKIIPQERQAEEDEVLAKVRAGLIVDHFVTQRCAKGGRLVDIALTVSPIRDWHGRIIGASKIARDISEQKRTAAAAMHLAAVIASADDAIISKDLNGIVQSWNPAAERLFGYGAAEMIGQSITRIIPRERLDEETYVLGRVRSGQSVEHFETVRQHQGRPRGRDFAHGLADSRCHRPDHRRVEDCARHPRAQAAAGRAAHRRRERGGGAPRGARGAESPHPGSRPPEERVRRQHVARAAHAAQLDCRIRRADGRRAIWTAAEKVSGLRATS